MATEMTATFLMVGTLFLLRGASACQCSRRSAVVTGLADTGTILMVLPMVVLPVRSSDENAAYTDPTTESQGRRSEMGVALQLVVVKAESREVRHPDRVLHLPVF